MERSGHSLYEDSLPKFAKYNWPLNQDFKEAHPEYEGVLNTA
jgi:hypothetical protein